MRKSEMAAYLQKNLGYTEAETNGLKKSEMLKLVEADMEG